MRNSLKILAASEIGRGCGVEAGEPGLGFPSKMRHGPASYAL